MPFEVSWREPHVLQVNLSGHHGMDENREMAAAVVEQLDSAKPPVFMIWDLSEMTDHPNNVKDLWETGRPILAHKTLTHVIFVGLNNPIIKFLTSIIPNMGHIRFHAEIDWQGVKSAIEKLKISYSLAMPQDENKNHTEEAGLSPS
jgi:hypothetical protein